VRSEGWIVHDDAPYASKNNEEDEEQEAEKKGA
jgi:hypothetical protein